MVKIVNELKDFQDILKNNKDKLVVVDFFADWCGPCRVIAPKYEEYSNDPKYKNVVFLKVNVDVADEIAASCGIQSMPTFQFYKNGKLIDDFSGADKDKLKAKLEAHKT